MNVSPLTKTNSAPRPFVAGNAAGNAAGIIAVQCELVRGTEDTMMRELLPRVKQQSVALDLSAVERIDAAGIALLITLYCASVEAGNEFSILAPSPRVLDILRLVRLESILVSENHASEIRMENSPTSEFSPELAGPNNQMTSQTSSLTASSLATNNRANCLTLCLDRSAA